MTTKREWEQFKVGELSTRESWVEPTCCPMGTVDHVAHISARVAIGFGLPGNTIWASKANPSQARKHNLSVVGAAWDIVLANSREQLESLLTAFPTETPRGPGKSPTVAA